MSEALHLVGCGIQHRPAFDQDFVRCEGENLCRDCAFKKKNASFRLTVTKAAHDDLLDARKRFGRDSVEYQQQLDRSIGYIRSSLEDVLNEAISAMEKTLGRGTPPPATQIG